MRADSNCSPTMLVILDGFGHSDEKSGNAIENANMPNWQFISNEYPSTLLNAAGESVGLLPGYIGNSEVGHLTIGAGRVIESVLLRCKKSIDDGSFFANKKLQDLFLKLKRNGKKLHLMGLLSDGGVHSHQDMLFALMLLSYQSGLKDIFIHAFLDGRDVAPQSAKKYLTLLDEQCEVMGGIPKLASIHGRFFAMDRDNNWDRIKKTYRALCGDILPTHKKWQEFLQQQYEKGIFDEHIEPSLLCEEGSINAGDGVIFFNIRPDRARQLTECFLDPNFLYFKRKNLTVKNETLAFFVTGALFKDSYNSLGCTVLFNEEKQYDTLLDVINSCRREKSVFISAETEKYAHVTYFFKGLRDEQAPYETRAIVPSIKTASYKDYPEMSAHVITQQIVKALNQEDYYFYLVNYANADMVGHSGDFNATVRACEILDHQLGVLYNEVVIQRGGILFITGDHGNAEKKIDDQGLPLTAHTTNKVPFVTVGLHKELKNCKNAGLSCVAPTILTYLQQVVPSAMTGASLL